MRNVDSNGATNSHWNDPAWAANLIEDVMERVIMTGGSHTSRMTNELDDTCLQVKDISRRGWRLSEETVEEKVEKLKEFVNETDERRTTVVYQLFDNVCYQVKKADGSKDLPCHC
jgi:hypothetical protein